MEWIKKNIKHDDVCFIESTDVDCIKSTANLSWILNNCCVIRGRDIVHSEYR